MDDIIEVDVLQPERLLKELPFDTFQCKVTLRCLEEGTGDSQ